MSGDLERIAQYCEEIGYSISDQEALQSLHTQKHGTRASDMPINVTAARKLRNDPDYKTRMQYVYEHEVSPLLDRNV